MKKLILLVALIYLSSYTLAQGLMDFSEIEIQDEKYGLQVDSYNAKDDDFSLEFNFGAITNFSEFSETNTMSGVITFYRDTFSYTLYGAINSLNVAATTNFTTNEETLSVYTVGAGFSRRSILINDFINIKSIYDEIQTNITYNLGDAEALGVDVAGLGFNASYGLIYRAASGMHLSARMVYNFMALEGDDDITKIKATASWVSAQAGLAFIF